MNINNDRIITLIIKLMNIVLSLVSIPLMLNKLGTGAYGIWVVLLSMLGWMGLFDFGLFSALRNKWGAMLVERNKFEFISSIITNYMRIILISFIGGLALLLIVDKTTLIDKIGLSNLSISTIQIVIFIGMLKIAFGLISSIYYAQNIIFMTQIPGVIEQLILISLLSLTKSSAIEVHDMVILYGMSSAISLLIPTAIFFGMHRKYIRWPKSEIRNKNTKPVQTASTLFFIIQLAGLIQFQLIGIIINIYFGPEDVAAYSIASKIYMPFIMMSTLIATPIWSRVTQYITEEKFQDIDNLIKSSERYIFILVFFLLIITLFGKSIIALWVGRELKNISNELMFALFIQNAIMIIGAIYVQALNGAQALRGQMISCIVSPVIFIALVFLFLNLLHLPVHYVIYASVISNFNAYLIAPILYKRWIKKFYKI